jgi:hypothetical protein
MNGTKLTTGSGETGVAHRDIIEHNMTTEHGSSGAPLIWLRTYKVIAIHTGSQEENPIEPQYKNRAMKIVPIVATLKEKLNSHTAFLEDNACKYYSKHTKHSAEFQHSSCIHAIACMDMMVLVITIGSNFRFIQVNKTLFVVC